MRLFVCALLVLAACGTAPPADGPSAAEALASLRLSPPPVHALLGHRAALELTSEQIEALDSIGQALHSENAPLVAELQALRSGPGGRRGLPTGDPAFLQLVGQIHENNEDAIEQVGGVLSEEQRARTCELFPTQQRARRSAPPLGQPGRPAAQRPPALPPREVWTWCARPDPE